MPNLFCIVPLLLLLLQWPSSIGGCNSLVHIELAAVDLSWDIIVRFGTDPAYKLPKSFFDDFVQVRRQQCKLDTAILAFLA